MAYPTLYVALGSAQAANGSITELSGNGYARQAVTLTYDTNSGQTTVTGAEFGPATANWTAGVVLGFFDAATGGNQLLTIPLTTAVLSGQSLAFGACTIQTASQTLQATLLNGGTIPPQTAFGALTCYATGLIGLPVTTGPLTLTAKAGGALSAVPALTTLTYAATLAPNAAAGGPNWTVTLTGNVTLNAIAAAVPGTKYKIFFVQDGTGSRTLTYGASQGYKTAGGAPTLSTAAGAIDELNIFYDGTTFWVEVFKAFA